MKRMKLTHNMDDVELEEVLTKSLQALQSYKEPNRQFPDRLANKIDKHYEEQINKIMSNMLEEITLVIKSN